MNFTFLLMRHAYSTHNFYKDEWKERHAGDKSYKQLPEFAATKYSPLLIDSPQIDLQHCPQLRTTLVDFSKLALVLCSPLKRCLQTCRQLLAGREAEIPVIVQPLLSNRVSAAWSIGSPTSSFVAQYKGYDFSGLEELGESWMVRMLSKLGRFREQEMAEKKLTMQQYLLEMLKQGQGESYLEFFERTRSLRRRIAQILKGLTHTDHSRNQVLIISHSCVLSFLLGNELNEKGKVKNKVSFQHCVPIAFPSCSVLGSTPVGD